MKKISTVISVCLAILLITVIFATTYKKPLVTSDNVTTSSEINNFKTYYLNGYTYYPDKSGVWASAKGILSEKTTHEAKKNFIKWQQKTIESLKDLIIPENEDQMNRQWPQKSKNYACWETFFLIMQFEYPEYYVMPREVFIETVKSEEFYTRAKKIYKTKKLNKFQRNILKSAIEVLDIINLKQ